MNLKIIHWIAFENEIFSVADFLVFFLITNWIIAPINKSVRFIIPKINLTLCKPHSTFYQRIISGAFITFYFSVFTNRKEKKRRKKSKRNCNYTSDKKRRNKNRRMVDQFIIHTFTAKITFWNNCCKYVFAAR